MSSARKKLAPAGRVEWVTFGEERVLHVLVFVVKRWIEKVRHGTRCGTWVYKLPEKQVAAQGALWLAGVPLLAVPLLLPVQLQLGDVSRLLLHTRKCHADVSKAATRNDSDYEATVS